MLNYRFDKREKLQGQRFVIGFEERKTKHKKQAANPQWLFLLTAWITFLGGKRNKNQKTKLSLFSGNAFGPFHGNLAEKPQRSETGHSGLIIRPVDICQSPPVPASVLFELAHFEATARHGRMASYFSLTKILKEESLGYLLSQSSSRHPTKPAPTVFVDHKLFPWKRSLCRR